MAKAKVPIRLLKGALDEVATSGGNQIVLRGVIDPASLVHLKVDEYQREALPVSALSGMWRAVAAGESLPDLELAMRGDNVDMKGDTFTLNDEVFIIDGQQRRNAALHALETDPKLQLRVGAMIHFNTTRQWERERFRILNLERSKVSPNVLIRNMRHGSESVLTLYGLSFSAPDFALHGRVCWKQKMAQEELLSARTLMMTATTLMAPFHPVRSRSLGEMVPSMDKQAKIVGLPLWRQNIIHFFDVMDECYKIRNITFRDLCLQTRQVFLVCVATTMAEHVNFWRMPDTPKELFIDADMRSRLASFPLQDPSVAQLIAGGAGGFGSRAVLTTLFKDHLNKGRSTNRLRSRKDHYAVQSFPSIQVRAPEDVDWPGKGE